MQSKWKMRFGVGTLLFLMVMVAGYFYGLHRGVETRRNNSLTSQVYSVARIVKNDQPIDRQLDSVVQLIELTVDPDSWISRGGSASILPYTSNRSIVVSQCKSGHAKVKDLLESLAEIAEAKVRSVEYDCSLIISSSSGKPAGKQMEAIVDELNQRFGPPASIPVEITASPMEITTDVEREVVIVRAREEIHSGLQSFFEQLRVARAIIDEIDR